MTVVAQVYLCYQFYNLCSLLADVYALVASSLLAVVLCVPHADPRTLRIGPVHFNGPGTG